MTPSLPHLPDRRLYVCGAAHRFGAASLTSKTVAHELSGRASVADQQRRLA